MPCPEFGPDHRHPRHSRDDGFVGFGVNESGGWAAGLDETVRAAFDAVRLFDNNDDVSLIFLGVNIDTGTSQGRLLRTSWPPSRSSLAAIHWAPFRERWFLSRMGNRTRVGENSVTAKSWMTVTNAGQTLADKIFAAQQAGEG